ncbi:nuclear transport factor 2 family protein [Agromyces salentinus]|uniref:SnoaL-like domain-containing protein n=1 Tax=Agromyces salentinus TaxID=269421 RepID=A0ABN2MVZ5_9MICO|nr:nuclear transport factor 2 family protein [Agromyces salentinus]
MTSAGEAWLERYVRAWATNDPADIAAVFSEDAVYDYRPDGSDSVVGRDAIAEDWVQEGDEPGTWTFDGRVLTESPGLVVVQGITRYAENPDYDNLWVIRLDDDGRATRFTEWCTERRA